jgi:multidrug efflux pump subunit AcrA (membrane-fusion protein)
MRISIALGQIASVLVLFTAALASAAGPSAPSTRAGASDPKPPPLVEGCLVTLIEEAEVPSQEAGVLAGFRIQDRGADGRPLFRDAQPVYRELHEGDEVVKGEVVAQIDDSQAKALQKVADMKLKVAEQKANETIMVRYARAAFEVANADLARAAHARNQVRGAISDTEYQEKWLKAKEEELSIEKAQHEHDVAAAEVSVQKAESEAAALDVDRRQLKAPLDGIVVERLHHVGEWLKPGDQVLRIVRMDRLRIKAYLNADQFSPGEVDKRAVTVTVVLAHGQQKSFRGKIVFASPIVEATGFLVQAEVDNEKDGGGHWVLRPGLAAEMEIKK